MQYNYNSEKQANVNQLAKQIDSLKNQLKMALTCNNQKVIAFIKREIAVKKKNLSLASQAEVAFDDAGYYQLNQ